MPVKRTSSAETAARFIARYKPNSRVRRWRKTHATTQQPAFPSGLNPTDRIDMNFARATVVEALDCVSARINECHARGEEPEHITNIAWQMLDDALHGRGHVK